MNDSREKRRLQAFVFSILAMSVGLTGCQISPLSERKASREALNLGPDQLDNGCYIRQGEESPDQYELRSYYAQRYSLRGSRITDPLPYWCVESVYTQKEIEVWAEKNDPVAIYTKVSLANRREDTKKIEVCRALVSELKTLADVKFENFKGDVVYRIPEAYSLMANFEIFCGVDYDDDRSLDEAKKRGYWGGSLDGSISANE